MKRWGLLMMTLGSGVFMLPIVQPHFRSINAIGNIQPIAAGVLVVAGAVILMFAMMHSNAP